MDYETPHHVPVHVGGLTEDQTCYVKCFLVLLLIFVVFVWFNNRRSIPVLQEHMTWWKMPRFFQGKVENFTARDAQMVMAAAADPQINWDKFQARVGHLKLHPLTFVKLQDLAKKNQLSQVMAAYLISDDHRYH